MEPGASEKVEAVKKTEEADAKKGEVKTKVEKA